MNYWLFKSEPSSWSWNEQLKKGEVGEEWDGVRNYQARNFMINMKVGEQGFFYHSQKEKSVVGIVEVIREARQDSTTTDKRWQCVQIKALKSMNTIVQLHQIKTQPELNGMMLVNNPRLSVQPVKEHEWKIVCSLGGVSP